MRNWKFLLLMWPFTSLINFIVRIYWKITLSYLKAIRERFRFSTIKNSSFFFRFWPLSRLFERKMMYQYKQKSDAAIRIQAISRSKRDRSIVLSLWVEDRRIMTSILISVVWRGCRARAWPKDMKQTKWLKKFMLSRLYCWFLMIFSRNVVYGYKESHWLVLSPREFFKIQYWKVHLDPYLNFVDTSDMIFCFFLSSLTCTDTPFSSEIPGITSISPTTLPLLSHTGKVKNLLSCIICILLPVLSIIFYSNLGKLNHKILLFYFQGLLRSDSANRWSKPYNFCFYLIQPLYPTTRIYS